MGERAIQGDTREKTDSPGINLNIRLPGHQFSLQST